MNKLGFTLVELVVAVVILTVGVLGFTATTTYLLRQTTIADARTERAAALSSTVERLRSLPYDSVDIGIDSVGMYAVRWSSISGPRAKRVQVITLGPGLTDPGDGGGPRLVPGVADTFTFRLLAP